jgi:hypothetical protein
MKLEIPDVLHRIDLGHGWFKYSPGGTEETAILSSSLDDDDPVSHENWQNIVADVKGIPWVELDRCLTVLDLEFYPEAWVGLVENWLRSKGCKIQ